MIAIDTNLVVRILANDDPDQVQKASRLIAGNAIFLATTVLLETEWVLRTSAKKTPSEITQALRAFLRLPTVHAQDAAVATMALDWTDRGMDFADALHLASAGGCQSFASFDRGLAKAASRLGAMRVHAPQ